MVRGSYVHNPSSFDRRIGSGVGRDKRSRCDTCKLIQLCKMSCITKSQSIQGVWCRCVLDSARRRSRRCINVQRSVNHIRCIVSGFIIFVPFRKSLEAKASVLHMSINITVIAMAKWFLEIGLKAIAFARGVTTALGRPLSMY